MARVAIIGAGVAGLASAIRLAKAGHDVNVYEANEAPGGKLASRLIDGFSFDIGPSLLTMPQLFDELEVVFSRIRLKQPFAYHFGGGSQLFVDQTLASTRDSFDALAPGAGTSYERLLDHGKDIWNVSQRTFFAGPIASPLQLLSRMKSPSDFGRIDALKNLHQRASSLFSDEDGRQWLDRYATYSGSSPYEAPATLACIPYLEHEFGCWHVPGGLATIATALVTRSQDLGVRIHYNSPVSTVDHDHKRVTGVVVGNGFYVPADVVVANVDADTLYSRLLNAPSGLRRVRRASRSTSGFAMLLGLAGSTPDLRHHNVWFSRDYKAEFAEISRSGVASEPTIYVCCSSVTNASEAPNGNENWFVLVNVKAGASADWSTYGDRIIERLGIRERLVQRTDLTPDFFAHRYGNPGGAIYGTSSNGRRAAFLRANNRGPVTGLYLAGGSAHPGGGLPLVLSSARIASELIESDGW